MIHASRLRIALVAIAASIGITVGLSVRGDDAGSSSEWKAPARAAKKKNPIPADAKSIAAGKDVYMHQCRSCHGDSGKGDGPAAKDTNPKPKDLGTQIVADQSDGALFWKITEGKKPMPSFEKLISEDERWEAINFVRTFGPPPAATTQK
jgi:mono/diheme cytochrome c family protein